MANISTPIDAYKDMLEHWRLPRDLLGGTELMRDAGERYLPKEGQYVTNALGERVWVGETQEAYDRRLLRTVLFNGYQKAINDNRGKVFSQPLIVQDASERLESLIKNIDLQGKDLTAFMFDVFGEGIAYGLSHVVADFTALPNGATLADANAVGARPWLVHVRPWDMIGWRYKMVGGAQVITQIRYRERILVPDGEYDVKEIERIRLITDEEIVLFQADSENNMQEVERLPNSLGFVPVVTFYTNQTGVMTAIPPLRDLAEQNLLHWQSTSDQRTILHVARVPILFASGMSDREEPIQIGSSQLFRAELPEARLRYVEHNSQATGAGEKDLENIQQRMAQLAMQPMLNKTGTVTATARALDQAEANSVLQSWAIGLKMVAEKSLRLLAAWEKRQEDPSVKVNTEFSPMFSDADLQSLMNLWSQGGLSRETLWSEMKRRGTLSEDFNAEAEAAALSMVVAQPPVVPTTNLPLTTSQVISDDTETQLG